jgi:limonene-1,2-epoxide hydrolase
MHPNERIARAWLDAFNRGDVAALVELYAEACTHTSPKIRVKHPETGGRLVGKAALTAWWTEALEQIAGLRYDATAVTAGEGRVVLEYLRYADGAEPMPVAEAFDIDDGRIVASRVYHG